MKKSLGFILIITAVLMALTGCDKKDTENMTLDELKTENVKEYYNRVDLTDIFYENGYLRTSVDLADGRITRGGSKDGIHYSYKEYSHTSVEEWKTKDYVYAVYTDNNTGESIKIKYKNDNYSSTYSNYLVKFRGHTYKETVDDFDLVEIYNGEKKCTAYLDAASKDVSRLECSSFTVTYDPNLNFDSVNFDEFQEVSAVNAYDINTRYID